MEKTVGHRRTDTHDAAALQRTMAAVRRTGALVPRGVYRFSSFEEAEAWMTRMMARTHVSRSSMISSASRVRAALQILEDKAVNDVRDEDVARYSVVRVADEIVVDLMAKACGVDYAEARRDALEILFDGVPIPVASPPTLIRTKNTMRPSDAADRQFLQVLIDETPR